MPWEAQSLDDEFAMVSPLMHADTLPLEDP